MRSTRLFLLLALALPGAPACGGAGGSTGAGGASTTASGTGGTVGGTGGGPSLGDDCAAAGDCGGSPCVEVTPGGFRTCQHAIPEIETCAGGLGGCCKTADCPMGSGQKCFPPYAYCGGILGPQNECLADACQVDADCPADPAAICLATGLLAHAVNTCLPAGCRVDGDCTEEPKGRCVPVDDPCCGSAVGGLYCAYPGTGCRHKSDCPKGHCAHDEHRAFCVEGSAVCAP
ncbi:MAG: hypothetical protein U0359_35790 [Byssovorax sp.]